MKLKGGFTVPWLDLETETVLQYANGQLEQVPETLFIIRPPGILANLSGKDVLCLASGGGQQSAVLSLLGARVTVVDLTEGQLEGDREAAAHYCYDVTTIHADMRDLSDIADDSFDLVYQGHSMSWIPDVREVYAQVTRVLRSDGLYRVDFNNPGNHFLEWDGEAYRVTAPYSEKTYRHESGAYDSRHYFGDIFNGLIEIGFSIELVEDLPFCPPDLQAPPGSWRHEAAYNFGLLVIARKC